MKKILILFYFLITELTVGAQHGTFTDIRLVNGDSTIAGSANGRGYYNTVSNKFRFYQNGAWNSFVRLEGTYANPSWISSLPLTKITGLGSGWASPLAASLGSGWAAAFNVTYSAGSGGGYATIQNGGSGLTQRTTLNFSTGFTAVDNSGSTKTDVTNNLLTGLSGGQTVIGGAGASENITLSSTSSGTKGTIVAQDQLKLSGSTVFQMMMPTTLSGNNYNGGGYIQVHAAGSGYANNFYQNITCTYLSGTSATSIIVNVNVLGGIVVQVQWVSGGVGSDATTRWQYTGTLGGSGSGFQAKRTTTDYRSVQGDFYSTMDNSYINSDGQADAVWQYGYNHNGTGGNRTTDASLHWAMESHYIGGGTEGTGDFEIHLEGRTRPGVTYRYFSTNIQKQSGYASSFWTMGSVEWRKSDGSGTAYFNVSEGGVASITGTTGTFNISNSTPTLGGGLSIQVSATDNSTNFRNQILAKQFNFQSDLVTFVKAIGSSANVGVGIGLPGDSSYPLYIQRNVNGQTNLVIENQTNGASSIAQLQFFNNADQFNIGLYSTAHTAYGALVGTAGYVYAKQAGGIVLMADVAGPIVFASGGNAEVARFASNKNFGLGITVPTSFLDIQAGTTSTAPLGLASGPLLTSKLAGKFGFLTDKLYFTITTGTAEKEIALIDAALTSGTVPVATTNGRLTNGLILAASTYTPTLTNTTNVTASTAYVTGYFRVGNSVTVYGKVDIDATLAASSATELQIALPIASNMTAEEDLGGNAISDAVASLTARIKADATTDRASIVFKALSLNNDSYSFEFSYQIK